jgi:tetratricopeptide (TPR) repeat protein
MTIASSSIQPQALQRARQFVAEGRLSEAEAVYRRIIEARPDFHPAYHGLALLAHQVDKLDIAAQLLASAIAIDGTNAIYHRDRGEICRRLKRFDEAVAEATAATRLANNDAEAHYNLGLALADREDYAAAVKSYRRAVELDPRHGRALNNMGSALEKLDDKPAAADAYRAAIAIDPRHLEAQNNLGSILSQNGDIDGARACFEKALEVEPRSVLGHYNSSTIKRYAAGDPAIAILESLAPGAESLPQEDRARLFFALGKMRDDLGRYDDAFAAYAEGNRLQAATLGFNEARGEQQAVNIVKHFDANLLAKLQGIGNPDPTPVFIVGMPRSGTTLIEQILSSHAQAYGAGELKDLHDVVGELANVAPGMPFPQTITTLAPATIRGIGDRYLERIHKLAPTAARITDKMPGNFHYLGLIHLALPNAKIIHSVRDPMDSCLSCYTHLFNDTMDFAYDLGTLGRYYVRYMKLMQHWHSVLPKGFILDVRYEEVVDDVEGQTRRMLEHIGLPWDAKCLEFYNNDRPVRTASLAQVRRPIYKSSVEGWRRFEKQLAPLLEIVKDYR